MTKFAFNLTQQFVLEILQQLLQNTSMWLHRAGQRDCLTKISPESLITRKKKIQRNTFVKKLKT